MRRALHSILAGFIVCVACFSPAAAKDTGPFRILAGPYSRKAVGSGSGAATSRFTIKGLTITVEFLEPESRASFLRKAASGASDPFAVPPGRPQIYHAVRVAFDNQSKADVIFQAGNVVLLTDRKEPEYAIDLTDLYRAAARGDGDPEGVFDQLAPAIFDSSTEIPKGRTIERLLVFGPLRTRWKELRLNFSYLQIGSETHSVSFLFHRQPLGG
ncbi:MAG TPA: hypothetical protein VGV60_06980 [Candidatus Polarisedimenticolia bacterium]|jgi:hypothetical protein|nr:hypothetical protein [Candidatus Polarisedimenticolia bacterium]